MSKMTLISNEIRHVPMCIVECLRQDCPLNCCSFLPFYYPSLKTAHFHSFCEQKATLISKELSDSPVGKRICIFSFH